MPAAEFQVQRIVEFADTDMAGIVHFARFFYFMEETEHAFLRSRGLSVVMTWENQHLGFPRVSARCDYVHPIRFEDLLDIQLRLERIGTKSLGYEFHFAVKGRAVATGSLVTCCTQTLDGRHVGIPIPESLKSRLRGA